MNFAEKPPFLKDVPVAQLLDAKIGTADFLLSIGETVPADEEIEAQAAHAAFGALTNPSSDDADRRQAIALLETPESVKRLVGMLTAYEWEYVQEAAKIRSFLVASILEDCSDPDPRVRLKAIEMAGKIKEVALFEERSVVRKENVSDEEINQRLSSLLAKAASRKREAPIEDAVFKEKTENA